MSEGTDFQNRVWSEIDNVPRGKVITYSQIAKNIGRPKAARAVANACGANPNPIKTPCHRVICSNGDIGGYSGSGGVKQKKDLLRKEGVKLF
jgi:methylated-DNA-[protein]-cysteine S-methyltransferase|tara:strand:+ start:3388 stop:3663 length:276 start_codon:yes stop_codon:yes gene_type:complete